jgi:Uma2 family endonuclease
MSTATRPRNSPRDDPPRPAPPLPLESGDHLAAEEFERRFDAMPDLKKAELIDGVVYVASPVSSEHGDRHSDLGAWLGTYRAFTPGVAAGLDSTIRLGAKDRLQPDGHLRILESCGGQARITEDGFIAGAPEFAAEIAVSSASMDLHKKAQSYRRGGVRKYLVWRVQDAAIDWFILRNRRYQPLAAGPDGLMKSEAFPGLWLDPKAMLGGDMARVLGILRNGLDSPEHAAFVKQLEMAGAPKGPG